MFPFTEPRQRQPPLLPGCCWRLLPSSLPTAPPKSFPQSSVPSGSHRKAPPSWVRGFASLPVALPKVPVSPLLSLSKSLWMAALPSLHRLISAVWCHLQTQGEGLPSRSPRKTSALLVTSLQVEYDPLTTPSKTSSYPSRCPSIQTVTS